METIKIVLDKQWVGFDLDDSISYFDYDKWLADNNWIGEPIPHMIKFIRGLKDAGFWVKLYTARAGTPSALPAVKKWIKKYVGRDLEITNVKSDTCGAIFDDRAYNCKNGLFSIADEIHMESLFPEKIEYVFKQKKQTAYEELKERLNFPSEEDKMDFQKYQKEARGFADYPVIGKSFGYPAMGLAGETGEVLDKIKKIFRDKNGVVSEEDRQDLGDELGDCLWYIANLAYELEFTLDEIAQRNIDKLTSRKERNVLGGSGDKR